MIPTAIDLQPYTTEAQQWIDDIFKLGKDPKTGACTALTYSKRLYNRTAYVKTIMQTLGMHTYFDAFANLIGVFETSQQKNIPRIMLTSHIDTVIDAGKYDGVLGIGTALAAVKYLIDSKQTLPCPIEVRVNMGEESPGLTATFGSKAVCGCYTEKDLEKMNIPWDTSLTVKTAIAQFMGWAGQPHFELTKQAIAQSQISKQHYTLALECHMEQFTLLKERRQTEKALPHIGIMTGVGGHLRQNITLQLKNKQNLFDLHETKPSLTRWHIHFSGSGGHTGATPMGKKYRNDALISAIQFIKNTQSTGTCFIETITLYQASPTSIPSQVTISITAKTLPASIQNNAKIRTQKLPHTPQIRTLKPIILDRLCHLILTLDNTACTAPVSLGLRGTCTQLNITENSIELFVDIRGMDMKKMAKITTHLQQTIPTTSDIELSIHTQSKKEPVHFHPTVIQTIEHLLDKQFPQHIMTGHPSVPGQDIGIFAQHGIPSTLLFIESGTGHHRHEAVADDALTQCIQATLAIIKQHQTRKKEFKS
jgi:acetylornithine deacetylase/succinyl-diaminopimelate desuccinylase-like protein